ncbi:MAG: RsmB/NOP family class I SAM-dependent RNA methyltransferase [Lentisphaerae bacterium]|nr:RsmB/NOP family class I SAM-dependent RNA methyltransferase [Lentisphaerota bacterium]
MNAHHIPHSQTRAIREAVVRLWPAVLGEHRPADRELADFLKQHHEFGGRDRRLIGDVVFGLLRWWGWLQGETPDLQAEEGEPAWPAWCRLFLSVALLEGDSPAAIHDYWAEAGGLAAEDLASLRARPDPADRLAGLFKRLADDIRAMPLVPAWVAGEVQPPCDLRELMIWMQRRPPLWLRVQTEAIGQVLEDLRTAGLMPEWSAARPDAIRLSRARVNLQALASYRAGRVEVQDISSQAVAGLCGARAGERWWDVCAGAGGKTLVLARAVGGTGRVHATDIRSGALDELQRRARRAGLTMIETGRFRAPRQSRRTMFDGVLVDAPCSGSGTWRRNPWARWQLEPADLAPQAERQLGLLSEGARAVKPGGALVYATCSLLRVENEGVVARFLEAHPAFAPAPFAHPFTGDMTTGILQLWPWDADGDAMFVARLRRGP